MVRKNFAPGLCIIRDGSPAAKNNLALVKRLSVNAPKVRQRFNKDAVHLRSMYKQLYPTESRLYEYGSREDLGDNSSDDNATPLKNNPQTILKKQPTMSSYAKNVLHSQQCKRDAMKKSLIPDKNPDVFNAMMTGSFIPSNLKPNILQNTPANVTLTRSNHMQKTVSLAKQPHITQQQSIINLMPNYESNAQINQAYTLSKISGLGALQNSHITVN